MLRVGGLIPEFSANQKNKRKKLLGENYCLPLYLSLERNSDKIIIVERKN